MKTIRIFTIASMLAAVSLTSCKGQLHRKPYLCGQEHSERKRCNRYAFCIMEHHL